MEKNRARKKPLKRTKIFQGTPTVSGVVYAPAVWVRKPDLPSDERVTLSPRERKEHKRRAKKAAKQVSDRLWHRSEAALGGAQEILAVQASLAMDPAWLKEVTRNIREGVPAPQAFIRASTLFAERFRQAGPHMAERITDLEDVRDRVTAEFLGQPEPGIPDVDVPSIILSGDLSPADTAGLDPEKYVGIASRFGGPTSHASILARQLGIPAVVAARSINHIEDGDMILLDGTTGSIWHGFSEEEVTEVLEREARAQEKVSNWAPPGTTSDGTRVSLLANVGDLALTDQEPLGLAEGIGLLRTEMAYLTANAEPTVADQVDRLTLVFEKANGKRVVIRTLDAGSDKAVPFLPFGGEANPALGMRGIRVSWRQPETLHRQLDAIAEAARRVPSVDVWVMAPMIATVKESEDFMALVHDRGLTGGVMIEVPSAALVADEIMKVVDFVSIGTNDLAQYTLASDRLSPDLAEYNDPWQPAVLRLTHLIGLSGEVNDKPVGVCGEAAADPLLACVLVGLGVNSLSMAAPAIPRVGASLAQVSIDQCQKAARATLKAVSPAEARRVALRELEIR